MRLALTLVAVLLAALALAGCIRDTAEPNHLRIAGIDVAAPSVATGTVALLVNVSVDNARGDSGPVRVEAKAFDQSTGLLVRTSERGLDGIPKDRTVQVALPLEVPRRSGYRLEVLLHEEGRLAQTASVGVSNVAALEPTLLDTGLRIGQIDFIVRNVTGSRVAIEAGVYLTNEGASASRDLRMQVKAREVGTGLVSDEAWSGVPAVAPEATRVLSVSLQVPQGYNYEVEVVLWDGDIMVERGRGAVQLLPTFTRNASHEIVVTRPDLRDFLRSAPEESGVGHGAAGAPGFEGAAALAGIALAGLALARRRRSHG